MQLQPGTYLQGDKYRIIRALGMGGFGITYLAEHELAGRNVCIKEFFPKEFYNRDDNSRSISLGSKGSADIMDAYKAKFIKEAKTIARLNHPNIIHIFDVFAENNTAYYVMEYIEGESLSAVVRERGALAEAEAIKYIRAVAEALGYIHERKIMHLDIKPANVMLRKEDGRAILIDFGLSKQYDAEGNQTSSTPVGISAGYAPMEQYQQGGVKEFSPETDIYSLGATLYYLVTGSVPPQAVNIADSGLPELPAHLSSGVRNAIERSMEIQRRRRPHSIKEFLALLEDNTPKVAVAPTPASVGVETKIEVQTAVVEEKTVISTPQPKVESKTKPQPTPKPKRSKRGLWIMLTAFVMAAVASFVLLGGELPPNNEIWYTSSDGNVVKPYKQEKDIFGAEIVSNTYENGKGIIKFDGDVTTIREGAFLDCSSLTSITLPNSVTTIEDGAFERCRSLKEFKGKYASQDGRCLIVDGRLVAFAPTGITEYSIPNSVTTIEEGAFYDCSSLTSITIPNRVTTIGDYAFAHCDNLTSVTLPNSVTTIGEGTFFGCSSLTSITIPNSVTTIEAYAFLGCNNLSEETMKRIKSINKHAL